MSINLLQTDADFARLRKTLAFIKWSFWITSFLV
jgi:hypothetical protein